MYKLKKKAHTHTHTHTHTPQTEKLNNPGKNLKLFLFYLTPHLTHLRGTWSRTNGKGPLNLDTRHAIPILRHIITGGSCYNR